MISYGRQLVDARDIRAVKAVLRSHWLTQGPKVLEFEKRFAEYCHARYAVAVCNGTAALHLAYLAAGVAKNKLVVTSPVTFLATANAAFYAGGRPVFADVESSTLNLDPRESARHLSRSVRVLAPVHFAGLSCDMRVLGHLAKSRGVAVVEDACHALGAVYRGNPVGSCRHSDMAVFSFHPVKSITTGEGGMITTSSAEIYQKLLDLRNHGMIRGERKRFFKEPWTYEAHELGFNYRLTDMQAALGIEQLKKLPSFILKRRRIAECYFHAFRNHPDIETPPPGSLDVSAWHLFVIRLKGSHASKKRFFLYEQLAKKGIQTQVHYLPVYLQPYYRRLGYQAGSCPVAEEQYKGILSLPIYPALSRAEILRISRQVKRILSLYPDGS